jgi:hypothetical protein
MNLLPLKKRDETREAKAVAEALRRFLAHEGPLDPWLAFPQNSTTFGFGEPPRPLPIGALRILWAEGVPWVQPCLECGATAHMIGFGGLLSTGGGFLICAGCGGECYQHLGGLLQVSEALAQTRLRGTEFAPSSMVFGATIGSDGKALLAKLGLPPIVQAPAVRMELGPSAPTQSWWRWPTWRGLRYAMTFSTRPSDEG